MSDELRIGHFQLVDRFAVGGVAEIFRALDVRTGELVAIKRMRPDLEFDPELTAGFLREIQISLLCAHDNLIRGYERGTAGGLDFIVLELIDGVDVEQLLARAGARRAPIPIDAACFMVCQALDGIAFAHDLKDERGRFMGLVHRDLTPRNLFVRSDGRMCVGDFGAACATAIEPLPTEIIGSPGYLSPEQASLAPLDRRSDLYTLGLVLHELVTGVPAFDVAGKKEAQILKAHQRAALKPPPKHVPEGLRAVLAIACAPERADRYASAPAMKRAITDAVGLVRPQAQAGVANALRELFGDELLRSRATA